MRPKLLRYGLWFSAAHSIVVAVLVPLEVLFREYPIGIIARQMHRIVDAAIWDAPRLLHELLTSQLVTKATLSIFPGPSAAAALITLELLVFGLVGGLFYFVVGVTLAWLLGKYRHEVERKH